MLSDIVVTDGKVFFSITVDAAAVKAWEPVRQRAEAAVRAVPGVVSALVALTAERTGARRGPSRVTAADLAPGRRPIRMRIMPTERSRASPASTP